MRQAQLASMNCPTIMITMMIRVCITFKKILSELNVVFVSSTQYCAGRVLCMT